MDAELQFHLESFANDLIRTGVPREEACRRAKIEFGGLELTKENCRDARRANVVESLLQDIRFGVRTFANPPPSPPSPFSLSLWASVPTLPSSPLFMLFF
jgi:hypothetical protein